MIESLSKELIQLAHPSGGWGYAANHARQIEPTCLSLLALGNQTDCESTTNAALVCLSSFRRNYGSYRLNEGREEAVWGTALSIVVLENHPTDDNTIKTSASFLLGVRGKPGQEDPETDAAFDIDIRLVGWPWAEGTFSWVEPTAWASLALQKCGQGSHPRVQEGIRLLLNRAFDSGGTNYGNKRVLETITEPIPGPSAVALLALQHHGHEARVQATRDYIRMDAKRSEDVEHLSLTKLALSAHGESDLKWLDERIEIAVQRHLNSSWAAKSPVKIALAILALQTPKRNPFLVKSAITESPLSEKPLPPRKRPIGDRIRIGLKSLIARGLDRMRQPPSRSVVH